MPFPKVPDNCYKKNHNIVIEITPMVMVMGMGYDYDMIATAMTIQFMGKW